VSLQLSFGVTPQTAYGADDFVAAPGNAAALALVNAWPDWPGHILALHGPAGSGKTHLAHIWAARSDARWLGATYDPAQLAGRALVLDRADIVPDEERLLHLLNVVVQGQGWLLLCGAEAPARWRTVLPDLRSRLHALPTATLEAADETLLRALLTKQFADRQLRADATLIDWLAMRIERTAAAARAVVAAIDAAALAERREIGLPLARRVLEEIERGA
jgi:chromosomal replication initiation ATPase DnaA